MDKQEEGTAWRKAGLSDIWRPCCFKGPTSGSTEAAGLQMGKKEVGQE